MVIAMKIGSGKPVVGATLVVARSRHQPVFIPLCGLCKAMVIAMKIGSGKPVVGATLVVARSRHQPVFIPLCGLCKAMVIPSSARNLRYPAVVSEAVPPSGLRLNSEYFGFLTALRCVRNERGLCRPSCCQESLPKTGHRLLSLFFDASDVGFDERAVMSQRFGLFGVLFGFVVSAEKRVGKCAGGVGRRVGLV